MTWEAVYYLMLLEVVKNFKNRYELLVFFGSSEDVYYLIMPGIIKYLKFGSKLFYIYCF